MIILEYHENTIESCRKSADAEIFYVNCGGRPQKT